MRITAGSWTARRLARGIGAVWAPGAGWMPEFLASNATVDIARREADIGIRNRRPDQPWLAGRRTGEVAYAIYAASPQATGYVALAEGIATTPSQRWLISEPCGGDRHHRERRPADPRPRARRPGPDRAADLRRRGRARTRPHLRADPELTHEEWLVSHHDARHDPPVRQALDAVHRLLTTRAP